MYRERLRGQLRVGAYNLFNRTNFSGGDTTARFSAAPQPHLAQPGLRAGPVYTVLKLGNSARK